MSEVGAAQGGQAMQATANIQSAQGSGARAGEMSGAKAAETMGGGVTGKPVNIGGIKSSVSMGNAENIGSQTNNVQVQNNQTNIYQRMQVNVINICKSPSSEFRKNFEELFAELFDKVSEDMLMKFMLALMEKETEEAMKLLELMMLMMVMENSMSM